MGVVVDVTSAAAVVVPAIVEAAAAAAVAAALGPAQPPTRVKFSTTSSTRQACRQYSPVQTWCVRFSVVPPATMTNTECVLPFDEYPPPPPTTTTRLRVPSHQIPDEGTVVVLSSLEIKTKLAEDRVNTALSLITRHGKDYFTVRGGDPLFYEVVPNEYRGQLLHQAVVLRLNYVLFVLARTSGVLYRVRVERYGTALAFD